MKWSNLIISLIRRLGSAHPLNGIGEGHVFCGIWPKHKWDPSLSQVAPCPLDLNPIHPLSESVVNVDVRSRGVARDAVHLAPSLKLRRVVATTILDFDSTRMLVDRMEDVSTAALLHCIDRHFLRADVSENKAVAFVFVSSVFIVFGNHEVHRHELSRLCGPRPILIHCASAMMHTCHLRILANLAIRIRRDMSHEMLDRVLLLEKIMSRT